MAMTTDSQHGDDDSHPNNRDDAVAPLGKRFLWVDTTSGVNRLIIGLIILCVILFVIDFIYHRHVKVPYEGLYGFYAIAGFVSFTLIVLGARLLRVLIRRDENYYAPHGVDAEQYPPEGTQQLHHSQRIDDSIGSLVEEMTGQDSGDRS
jgi:hypothetical protein